MKITNENLIKLEQEITTLQQSKIKMGTKFKLFQLQNEISDDVKELRNLLNEIFRKYGKPENDKIIIPNEKIKDFDNEYKELMSQEYSKELNFDLKLIEDLEIDGDFSILFTISQ